MDVEEFIKHGKDMKDHKDCPICHEWYLDEFWKMNKK